MSISDDRFVDGLAEVYGWGDNKRGQLCLGPCKPYLLAPELLVADPFTSGSIVGISTGHAHTTVVVGKDLVDVVARS